jgi:putative endonuclease
MALHNKLGADGETLALRYLIAKNYTIHATNWRWHKAEVDIIAQKDKTLVFVEVKTRSSDGFSKPEEAVNQKKQSLLIEAAEAFCDENNIDLEIRFDIIAIIHQANKTIIKQIEAAF